MTLRRRGAVAAFLFLWLIAAQGGCVRSGGEEEPATPPPAASLSERIAARPAWLGAADSLSPALFEADPHSFACASCHGTRPGKSEKEWKATCTASGCHFRAWPKTQFHRVSLSVFNKCDNCHKPHVFSVEGEDCASCHEALMAPGAVVTVSQIPGVKEFPHGNHAALGCAHCHESETTHGALKLDAAADCRSCHHGPGAAGACQDCHAPAEINGPRRIGRTVNVASTTRSRRLPFDHARHADLDCGSCHASDLAATPVADCMSCHEFHHQPESSCASCHEAPKAGAHDLAVHETACSTCHGPNGFPAMESNRNFCMSCHVDQTAHYPDRNCESCHKLGPGAP